MAPARLKVRLLPIAEKDLGEALTYLTEESPQAAERLADRFEEALGGLAAHPRLGRVPQDATLAALGYRFLIVEDYLIFYALDPGVVVVHRIIHGARDLQRLL